jgi:hypothetical protein
MLRGQWGRRDPGWLDVNIRETPVGLMSMTGRRPLAITGHGEWRAEDRVTAQWSYTFLFFV